MASAPIGDASPVHRCRASDGLRNTVVRMMPVRLGEMLVKERLITTQQLQEAVREQRSSGRRVGSILVDLGYVGDEEITALLSRQYGVPSIDLSQFDIDPGITLIIPPETARKYQVVPLSRAGATLTIAMTDPTNVFAVDDIKFMTGYNVETVVASEAAVLRALDKYFPAADFGEGSFSALETATRELADMSKVHDEDVEILGDIEHPDVVTLEQQSGEAPVVRMVNVLLASAIHKDASDIHIEPYETELRIRFRVDGVLHNVMVPPLKMKDALTSRIKIMARLDIAEKRLPQDGRLKMRFRDGGTTREIDLRVSSLPTLFGEKIVLRLLDRSKLMLDMKELGFEPESLGRFEESIRRPWGMVLVTGPTGSGKTNTLYSSVTRINSPGMNIVTVEDPVEFNLPGVNQVQVREGIGLTFAAALRSFLRQDPNVILVGEIRDVETAGVAVKAALTGHLVLSSLHTNDAPSSINRLINMGVEPFLVAGSVNLICAQRLVRRVCSQCAEPMPMAREALLHVGFSNAEADHVIPVVGRGCAMCQDTGVPRPNRSLRGHGGDRRRTRCDRSSRTLDELRHLAIAEGMLSLRQSGLRKISMGLTTVEEVTRETTSRSNR